MLLCVQNFVWYFAIFIAFLKFSQPVPCLFLHMSLVSQFLKCFHSLAFQRLVVFYFLIDFFHWIFHPKMHLYRSSNHFQVFLLLATVIQFYFLSVVSLLRLSALLFAVFRFFDLIQHLFVFLFRFCRGLRLLFLIFQLFYQ